MSCGLRDVTNLEALGRPALLVHTDAFDRAAGLQAEMLGQPAMRRAIVSHPVQDKNASEIRAFAAQVLARILDLLADGQPEVRA
ncbi:MAG: hypothetical protein JRF61_02825 [Deltaproteobacteria bacterium]|nr:hypothetical protein [Deltaproteobacteria bacterium]